MQKKGKEDGQNKKDKGAPRKMGRMQEAEEGGRRKHQKRKTG